MTREELERRVRHDEDGLTERKQSGRRDGVIPTIVAFANSTPPGREAVLYVGVRPDKTVVGIDGADALQIKIRQWANVECTPPIDVHCEVLSLPEGNVLAVVVPSSPRPPHFWGHAYRRVGSVTEKATGEILEELIASRNDKARLILSHKGEVVAVDVVGRPLGSTDPHPGPDYRTIVQCRIEGCSAHSVQLFEIGCSRTYSVPLDDVVAMEDPERQRPLMLRAHPR